MPLSPKSSLRSPVLSDTANVPRDFTNLTSDLDGRLVTTCTSATRPTGTALYAGAVIYELNTKAYGWYDGSGWRMWDTSWQIENNGAKFSHSGSGGMTGNTCIVKYMRAGKRVTVSWLGTTQAGTNYGTHGNVLLGLPTGISADPTGIPRGVYRSTVGNVWHHGILIHPAGDGTRLFAAYVNNVGGPETYLATNGSVAGNFISAQAVIELA